MSVPKLSSSTAGVEAQQLANWDRPASAPSACRQCTSTNGEALTRILRPAAAAAAIARSPVPPLGQLLEGVAVVTRQVCSAAAQAVGLQIDPVGDAPRP